VAEIEMLLALIGAIVVLGVTAGFVTACVLFVAKRMA
jgi:hypothetical protein